MLEHIRISKDGESMKKLGLLRIGKVELKILRYLQTELKVILQGIFDDIQIINKVCKIPKNSYDAATRKFLAPLFMFEIRNYAEERDFDKILGITSVELLDDERESFFGQAEYGPEAKIAMISLYYLFPESYKKIKNLLLERVLKETLHEIGHTLGLEHCINNCVMIYSDEIISIDIKPAIFCEECREKILKVS